MENTRRWAIYAKLFRGEGNCLSRGTRDVEPLVNARVDRRRSLVLVGGDLERRGVGAVGAVGDGDVGAVEKNMSVELDSHHCNDTTETHRLMSPLGVLAVISFSHASAHSRTTSITRQCTALRST